MEWYVPSPYGIFPKGNEPTDCSFAREGTIGRIVRGARDETEGQEILNSILVCAGVKETCTLSETSSYWYVHCHTTELWRQHSTALSPNQLKFHNDWKTTCVRLCAPKSKNFVHQPLRVSNPVFNDALFQSWLCTILPPDYKIQKMQRFLHVDRVSGLSPDDFRTQYEKPNIPVIMTDIVPSWKVFKLLNGDFGNLGAKRKELFGDSNPLFRCEHTNMTAEDYVRYALQQNDERPVYLFDAEFGSSMHTSTMYDIPPHFARDDFFSILGNLRPKHRWLIAGPKRAGSSYHIDPNFTSAWNACLTGRKRWLLFPPNHVPPGVHPSKDMRDVATPVSISEWFLNHYETSVNTLSKVGYECVCEAGDIIFVPAGWWHCVINLEDSVALTQNYVSECNLGKVTTFLNLMTRSISGVGEDVDGVTEDEIYSRQTSLRDRFVSQMKARHPESFERAERERDEDRARKRKREEPRVEMHCGEGGFQFSF